MKNLEISGQTIAYKDIGQGPPVILAHCSSASHKEWTALIRQLETSHRVLAPDLIGYGRSSRWPEDLPLDPAVEVEIFVQLTELAGKPCHMVGHSYGAMLLLEAARLLGENVRSLTLIEPVAFQLLRPGGHTTAFREIHTVARAVVAAMERGDARSAAAHYMGFWVGRLRWWLTPAKIKASIVDTVGKVAKEFALVDRIDVDLAEYAAIRAPARLILGARTRAPAKAVVDVLLRTLPTAHLRVIQGAGHMSPITHTEQVNALILEHIEAHSR